MTATDRLTSMSSGAHLFIVCNATDFVCPCVDTFSTWWKKQQGGVPQVGNDHLLHDLLQSMPCDANPRCQVQPSDLPSELKQDLSSVQARLIQKETEARSRMHTIVMTIVCNEENHHYEQA